MCDKNLTKQYNNICLEELFMKLNRARMNARNKVQCKSKKRKLGRLKQLHDNPYTFQQDEQLRINASFFFPPPSLHLEF